MRFSTSFSHQRFTALENFARYVFLEHKNDNVADLGRCGMGRNLSILFRIFGGVRP